MIKIQMRTYERKEMWEELSHTEKGENDIFHFLLSVPVRYLHESPRCPGGRVWRQWGHWGPEDWGAKPSFCCVSRLSLKTWRPGQRHHCYYHSLLEIGPNCWGSLDLGGGRMEWSDRGKKTIDNNNSSIPVKVSVTVPGPEVLWSSWCRYHHFSFPLSLGTINKL